MAGGPDLPLISTSNTTSTSTLQHPSSKAPGVMAQAIASTAKAIGIGIGSLSVIAYLALWGGQRQVRLPPRTRNPPFLELMCFLS